MLWKNVFTIVTNLRTRCRKLTDGNQTLKFCSVGSPNLHCLLNLIILQAVLTNSGELSKFINHRTCTFLISFIIQQKHGPKIKDKHHHMAWLCNSTDSITAEDQML